MEAERKYWKGLTGICLFIFTIFILSGCGVNLPPEANAGQNQSVEVGELVELNGRASWDPNGDSLTFEWSMVSVPDGSDAELEYDTGVNTYFTPDIKGNYIVQLVVSDGVSYSSRDLVTVVARAQGETDSGPHAANHYGGLNKTCIECHNGVDAVGKSASHIVTTENCIACHFQLVQGQGVIPADSWLTNTVDHVELLGTCATCHLPPGDHAEVGILSQCAFCHSATSWFAPTQDLPAPPGAGAPVPIPFPPYAPVFDHTGVIDGCTTCHNGANAAGKNTAHIQSSNECQSCHTTSAWFPVRQVSHAQVQGTCASCHNAVLATGKPVTHIPTIDQCGNCHVTAGWRPAVQVDHSAVIGICAGCHNGAQARGKESSHIMSTVSCDACHTTSAWKPVATIEHASVLGSCADCHALPAVHPNSGTGCDQCHSAQNWRPIQ